MKSITRILRAALLAVGLFTFSAAPTFAAPNLKALIVDGQNNHNWKATTPVLKSILEETGLFTVEVATSPPHGQPMDDFQPDFAKYDVIVSNYNGDEWPQKTKDAFVRYMKNGGGLVTVHAADNAFGNWKEWNEIIGLGGWGGRNEKNGPYVYWKDGKLVRDNSKGSGGSHGQQTDYVVTIRNRQHPITRGLPEKWLHVKDEMYSRLRGPAENMTLLATGYQDPKYGATGRDEPLLFTIQYGQGRTFHTVLGHGPDQMKCVGFIVTLQRGAEWAATGKVTQTQVPPDFPTANRVSLRLLSPALFQAIERYDFGASRKPLATLEEAIRNTPPKAWPAIEAKLLVALQSPKTKFAGKQFVCRMLRRMGSATCVPALAALLTDKELAHMARFALQFLPAPEAGAALREALGRTTGDLQIGVIGSLGQRGDRAAVAPLARLLGASGTPTARAVLVALGRIGGAEAARALTSARVPLALQAVRADAALRCADSLLTAGQTAAAAEIYRQMTQPHNATMTRVAAYRGLTRAEQEKAVPLVVGLLKDPSAELQELAGKLILETPGAAATRAFAAQLPGLNPDAQVVLVSALESRGDSAAASAIAELVKSPNPDVQLAAIRALGTLGNATQVELLVRASATEGEAGQAALTSLSQLRGKEVGPALGRLIAGNQSAALRANAIQVVVARRDTAAAPMLLKTTRDPNVEVRAASIRALGALGTEAQVPALVGMLGAAANEADRGMIANALSDLLRRVPEANPAPILRALGGARSAVRVALIALLPQVSGEPALQAARQELKSRDAAVKKAAIQALSNWPEAAPMKDLLSVAQNEADSVNRVLALRGYLKLVGIPANRSSRDTVALLAEAMKTAKRPDEKRAILSALPKYACAEAVQLAEQAQQDPAVKQEAALAANKLKSIMINKRLRAKASRNEGNARNALDGNKATRWDTGRGMKPGDWFLIDMGVEDTVTGITLDAAGSSGDYPRGYEVYASFDGGNWGQPIVTGKGTQPLTDIHFPKPVRTRYLKIVQTGSVPNLFWSIHDLRIHFK